MNEDIGAAAVLLDETETLFSVEPLTKSPLSTSHGRSRTFEKCKLEPSSTLLSFAAGNQRRGAGRLGCRAPVEGVAHATQRAHTQPLVVAVRTVRRGDLPLTWREADRWESSRAPSSSEICRNCAKARWRWWTGCAGS